MKECKKCKSEFTPRDYIPNQKKCNGCLAEESRARLSALLDGDKDVLGIWKK